MVRPSCGGAWLAVLLLGGCSDHLLTLGGGRLDRPPSAAEGGGAATDAGAEPDGGPSRTGDAAATTQPPATDAASREPDDDGGVMRDAGATAEGAVIGHAPGTTPPDLQCSFDDFGGHRYWFCTQNRERVEARARCAEIGGELVSLGGTEELSFLEQHAGDGDWLIGGERTTSDFFWYDGTPFTFTPWADGEPDLGECLQLRNGLLDAMACSDAEDWICEVP